MITKENFHRRAPPGKDNGVADSRQAEIEAAEAEHALAGADVSQIPALRARATEARERAYRLRAAV